MACLLCNGISTITCTKCNYRYSKKYLKYKQKYLNLKSKQEGGMD